MSDGSSDDPPELFPDAPPDGTRVSELEIGGQTVLVLSYPIEASDPLPETPLSSAEIEVARLAIEGLSNGDIAARRRTSIRTVANQMASILRKLGLTSRRELASRYHRGALGERDRGAKIEPEDA